MSGRTGRASHRAPGRPTGPTIRFRFSRRVVARLLAGVVLGWGVMILSAGSAVPALTCSGPQTTRGGVTFRDGCVSVDGVDDRRGQ